MFIYTFFCKSISLKIIFLNKTMVIHICNICQYQTPIKCNFEKHLRSKKHVKKSEFYPKNEGKKEGNEGKSITKKNQKELILFEKNPHFICHLCCKQFSRNDNLQRHLSICKMNNFQKKVQKDPQGSKKEGKSISLSCHYCHNVYQTKRGLNKHIRTCLMREKEIEKKLCQQSFEKEMKIKILEKDLEKEQALNQQKDKTIEIAKNSKRIINNINTTNKTINYLNNQYGEMIAMEQFLYNLQHTEQLTQEEREKLLVSYKDSGIELFARSFSHIMKENCRRQLLKEGLPDMNLIPLYCSDGNFRSHKEKGEQGWNTHYDNHSINKMINISSQQVYQSYQKPLMIFGKERDKVFKQIKQDNHSKKLKKIHKIEDS